MLLPRWWASASGAGGGHQPTHCDSSSFQASTERWASPCRCLYCMDVARDPQCLGSVSELQLSGHSAHPTHGWVKLPMKAFRLSSTAGRCLCIHDNWICTPKQLPRPLWPAKCQVGCTSLTRSSFPARTGLGNRAAALDGCAASGGLIWAVQAVSQCRPQ